jgi:hypothetical protein
LPRASSRNTGTSVSSKYNKTGGDVAVVVASNQRTQIHVSDACANF